MEEDCSTSKYRRLRTTYFSSKIVKNAIQESVSKFECPWQPIAENLNTDSARCHMNCSSWCHMNCSTGLHGQLVSVKNLLLVNM